MYRDIKVAKVESIYFIFRFSYFSYVYGGKQ